LYSKNGLNVLLEELEEPPMNNNHNNNNNNNNNENTKTTTTTMTTEKTKSNEELNENPTANTGLSSSRPSSREEFEERAMAAFVNNPQMPVQQKHQMIFAYQELSNALKNSFRKIADEGRVVTKEDIVSIFSNLSKNNKRKRDEFE